MNIILTLNRSAPAYSTSIYLDFARFEVSRGKERAHLWPKAFRLVTAILCSPKQLTTIELIDHLYGEMIDGGPEYARNCIAHWLCHARQRLRPHGISFRGHGAGGYEIVDLWAALERAA